ncbi:MAG: DinB family protein [Chloroflexi bacterium]|nr:DinB family protein [Chloroflexota bacterium]
MDSGKLLRDVLDRNEHYLLPGFERLTDAELRQTVAAGGDPIGWLMWHLTRVQDRAVAGMSGGEQLWIRDGWHAKLGREADPEERGNGDTPEQVAAFAAPSAALLVEYYVAARAFVNELLDTLEADDPERLVPGFGAAMVPLSSRAAGLVIEAVQHTGQVAYARGVVQGEGWMR